MGFLRKLWAKILRKLQEKYAPETLAVERRTESQLHPDFPEKFNSPEEFKVWLAFRAYTPNYINGRILLQSVDKGSAWYDYSSDGKIVRG